jgi:hypothetical protein
VRGSDDDDPPPGATRERATLRDVDRAIEELRKRRTQARAARLRVRSSPASGSTRAAPEEIDEELAAMDAEVAAAMTQLDKGRGEEASLEADVQKENAERAMGPETNAKTEKNANSLRSSPARVRPPRARRAGARSVGPALGSGVFGAREASAAEAKAEAAAAKAEGRASRGRAFGADADATAAVTSWTRDVDAALSKLDACDEVVRAKRAYFKERRERNEK